MVSANRRAPRRQRRNAPRADSVARLLAFAGHVVERDLTRPTPARRWTASARPFRRCGAARSLRKDGYRGETRPSWRHRHGGRGQVERIEATLERFRIHFDWWERESEVEVEISEADRVDTFEEDGALWAMSAFGDDKDRVLVRSDGRRRSSRPTPPTSQEVRPRPRPARYVSAKLDHHGNVVRLQALGGYVRPTPRGCRGAVDARRTSSRWCREEDVEAARPRSAPRRSLADAIGDAERRGPSSARTDQTISSTSTASSRTKKNPLTMCRRAAPGSLRTRGTPRASTARQATAPS